MTSSNKGDDSSHLAPLGRLFAAGPAVVRCLTGAHRCPGCPFFILPEREPGQSREKTSPGPEVHSSPGPQSRSVSCALSVCS